jgi:hypothetical protein
MVTKERDTNPAFAIDKPGHSVRSNVQEPCRLCLYYTFITAYYQKDLDGPPAMGRLHALCQSDSSC